MPGNSKKRKTRVRFGADPVNLGATFTLIYERIGRETYDPSCCPIRLINESSTHCWFTVALVGLIDAKRKIYRVRLNPLNLPTYNEGFENAFTIWCQLTDYYILKSTAVVRMFVNAFVTDPVRRNNYLNHYMSPDDFINDFGNSQLAHFYTHRVKRTLSRERCFCTRENENESEGASS